MNQSPKIKIKCKYGYLLLFALILTVKVVDAQVYNRDFLGMKGIRVVHPFADADDSLSVKEMVELCGEDGVPVWFGRNVRKIVCLTGECQIARVWLFWNGVGDYLGFQLHNNEPLTKTNHIEFSIDDYKKLNSILSDSAAVLKGITSEELTKEEINKNLDVHSGATRLSYKKYLVEDAAYTCYALWHTVYGFTRTKIKHMFEQRIDSGFLLLLLDGNNIEYKRRAIEYIAENPQYQHLFNPDILSMLTNDDEETAQLALNYLSPEIVTNSSVKQILFSSFDEMNVHRRFQFVWKLSQMKQLDDKMILFLLKKFEQREISASLLVYVYKSIEPENLKNREILRKLKSLSKHQNPFVRNLTQRLLTETSD